MILSSEMPGGEAGAAAHCIASTAAAIEIPTNRFFISPA
jgi:hypothetical protein